jgi:hypothetical protein
MRAKIQYRPPQIAAALPIFPRLPGYIVIPMLILSFILSDSVTFRIRAERSSIQFIITSLLVNFITIFFIFGFLRMLRSRTINSSGGPPLRRSVPRRLPGGTGMAINQWIVIWASWPMVAIVISSIVSMTLYRVWYQSNFFIITCAISVLIGQLAIALIIVRSAHR